MKSKKGEVPYSFTPEYVRSVSKEKFIAKHSHLADIVDLDAEWDKHNPAGNSKDKEKAKAIAS